MDVRANRDIEETTLPGFDPAEVRRIRADSRLLERFYLTYYDEVVRYFARRLSDPQDVADLVADTFIAAVDAAESYDHRRGQALPWLIGIAHNKLRRWYRRRDADRDLARRIVGRRLLDSDDIGELENRIDAAALAPLAVLNRLSPDQRELLDLVAIQGFTPAEIATVLGVPSGVARIRLHRARKALRREFGVQNGQQEER
jgi:RNA polymerase sigma factor (sigma-70 family)